MRVEDDAVVLTEPRRGAEREFQRASVGYLSIAFDHVPTRQCSGPNKCVAVRLTQAQRGSTNFPSWAPDQQL
jgi:hypothetical protein